MKTPIGEMREPAAIQTPTRTTDESGGDVISYADGDCIFLAIRAIGSREMMEFAQVNAEVSHVCFGHWCDLYDVSSKQRIKVLETGQTFDIAGPPMNDPKRAWSRLNLIWRENA